MTKEQRKKRQEQLYEERLAGQEAHKRFKAEEAARRELRQTTGQTNFTNTPEVLEAEINRQMDLPRVTATQKVDPVSLGNNLMQQNLAAAAQAEANRMRARNPVQIADLPTAEEWNAKNSLDLGLNRSSGKTLDFGLNRSSGKTLDLGLKHSNEKIAKSYDNMTPEEKADKWLDPSYKMTQDERYEAKKTAEDFMHQFDGMNMMEIGAYMKEHPEAEAQYQKMKNLTAKASTLGNAAEGFRSAFTNLASGIVDMGLDSAFNRAREISGISELAGANPEDVRAMLGKQVEELKGKKNDFFAPAEERARNAETQNPVAFGVGKFGGMAAQYALTNPAFDAIGAAAGLGKAGQFALNQVGQNLQDVALDTLPTYNQLKRGGASDEEIAREMAKNVGINVASNLGMGALGEIPELVNGVRNARNDVINAARNYDPQIQNAIESTETAARNIDAISNQIPKVNADEMADDIVRQLSANETVRNGQSLESLPKQRNARKIDLDDLFALEDAGRALSAQEKNLDITTPAEQAAKAEYDNAVNAFWEHIANERTKGNIANADEIEETLRTAGNNLNAELAKSGKQGVDIEGFIKAANDRMDSDGLRFYTKATHTPEFEPDGATFRELSEDDAFRVSSDFDEMKRFVSDMDMERKRFKNASLDKTIEDVKATYNAYYDAAMSADHAGMERAAKDFNNAITRADTQFKKAGGKTFASKKRAIKNLDALNVVEGYRNAEIDQSIIDEMAQPTPLARPVDRGRSVALESRDSATLTGEPSEVRKKFSDIVNNGKYDADYPGVDVEYNDKFVEPEKLTYSLTGEQVSPEFAAAVRKLESGKDISVEEYRKIPEIAEAQKRAGSAGDATTNIQTPERKAQRQGWLEKLQQTSGSATKQIDPVDGKLKTFYNGVVRKDRRADIILGLPSSGKSSAVVDPISFKYKSRLIDSDEAKKLIPEFDGGWGAGRVHEESSDIADTLLKDAVLDGENIVIPKVGGKYDSIKKLIDMLKAEGYSVNVHFNDLNPNKAAGRNMRRLATQGRFLDLETTSFKYGNKPSEVFDRLVKEGDIDGYTKVSNDVRIGENPVQLGGTEDISFDWGNNGQGRGTGTGNFEKGFEGTQERIPLNGKSNEIPTLNGRENPVQLGVTGKGKEGSRNSSSITGPSDLPDAKTDIPKLEDGKKISQTYTNTGKNGGGWNEGEYANYTDPRNYHYETISERESVEAAQQMRVEEGREAFANRVMEKERVTSQELDGLMMEWRETVAEARAAEESGQDASGLWEESNRIFKKVQEQSTSNAQALQALAKWSRNTPEGLLMNAENLVNQRTKLTGQSELKKEFDKWAKRNAKTVEFSPEFQRDFLNEAEKLQGLDMDSREAKNIMARLGKMVNEQMPVKFNEKVQSFLMDNMLGNFRTLITRNAGGNLGLASAEQFAQRPLAAGLDRLVSKKTGRRTQAGMSVEGLKEYFTGMKKGILDEAHDVRTGLHTARSGENTLSRAIDSNRHVFKTKVMDKLDAAVKHGLSVGDRPFYEATYKQTLGDYQRLREQGVMGDVIQNLSDADFKQYAETAAKLNALSAVYQNDSALSNALMSLKNGIGELSQGVLGVDVLSQFSMPFVKTPANVVDRAIDYSPIGFVRNAIRTKKEGGFGSANFDQNRFVNETARNILGTGFMAGAGVGAANGLMSGAYSEDKDEKAAQRNAGMQEYALNLPDGYQMDISWIPVLGSNAVAAAAAVDAAKKGDGNALENLGKGLLKGGEAMFDQSMFQGMQRLFGGDGYYNSDNGIVGNMVNTVTSGFGQAIPSLVRQAAQVTDQYSRDTSNSGEGNYIVNSLMNSIPWLREQLAPRVDTRGNLVEENQGRNAIMKVLEDMIIPGKLTKVEEDPLDTEASRLFEVTNNKTSFMPKAEIGDITVDDERPSNDEWVAYQQDYGKRMTEAGEALINSDAYSQLSDERKEKSLSNLYKDVRDAIKSDYTGKEVDGASKVYKEQGLDATIQYVLAQGALSEVGLQNNEANRELFHSGGVEAIEEKASSADMLKGLGLSATADNIDYLQQHAGADTYIPTLVDNGLKSQSQWRTYEQAKNVIPSLSAQDFSTTYNKINTDRNTSIKQDEITAYLNAIKASAAQAQQINKAYGNGWKKTLQQKDGKWVYK